MEFTFPGKTIVLNDEQANAVCRPSDVHQRIIAAAGSGKTTTLTSRVAWLICNCGVPPESIVIMTFSRNAANEMLHRIEGLIGRTNVWSGTFHGLARTLLQVYQPSKLQTLYFVDELVTMGIKWLLTNEGRKWVNKLRYIFVDEFQDINESQWTMIQAMRHPGARLIVVGDDAQNIYTWRGSNVEYILRLEKGLIGLVDDQLRINYRSTEAIIACANSVMQYIPTLPWKQEMRGTGLKKGERPEVRFFWRMCDETRWIVKAIQDFQKENPEMTIAVLSRTNMDLYRIEEEFLSKGIAYSLRDTPKPMKEKEHIEKIHLTTLHASKGLEWDIVFLLHCNDDSFPASKRKEDIVCERRLFYVAITRARSLLYISYVKNERDLSRFVREIPNKHLLFHGLAKYCLSDAELGEGIPSLESVVNSLDGASYAALREKGILNWMDIALMERGSLSPQSGLWFPPKWTRKTDLVREFYGFLRGWTRRYISIRFKDQYTDPVSERLLFTLRVFAEDKAFWLEWKDELQAILYYFFSEKTADPPAVEYGDLLAWSERKGLGWTSREILNATSFIAKIRGQLRPLRFDRYDLHEFTIRSARFVVPSEWRLPVLRSWRRICNFTLQNHDILEDIWRLATLEQVAMGRNAPLYRVAELKNHIDDEDFLEYLCSLEKNLSRWMDDWDTTEIGFEIQKEGYLPELVDFFCQNTFWQILSDDKSISQKFLVLALTAGIAQELGFDVRSVGVFLPLEERWYRLRLPENWKYQYKHILDLPR
jgi:hypothetical protein